MCQMQLVRTYPQTLKKLTDVERIMEYEVSQYIYSANIV